MEPMDSAAGASQQGARHTLTDLAATLQELSRSAASAEVRKNLASADNPADVIDFLLSQPQCQLRSHGLLAARRSGRVDLLLKALKGDPYTWKCAAGQLFQMNELPGEVVTDVVRWVLQESSPAESRHLLRCIVRRKAPNAIGSALFGALIEADRLQDALGLVRHAGALTDAELTVLAKKHLVEEQKPLGLVPAWACRVWKRLAVARPLVCIDLLRDLWQRARVAFQEKENELQPTVVTLLHGTAAAAAIAALQPHESYCDGLLLSLLHGYAKPPLPATRQLIEELAAEQAASGGVMPQGVDERAWQIYKSVFLECFSSASKVMRWAHKLQRRGILLRVLRTAGLEGSPLRNIKKLTQGWVHREIFPRCAYLAAPRPDEARQLMVSAAAADAQRALFGAQHPHHAYMPTVGNPKQPWTLWMPRNRHTLPPTPPYSLAGWPGDVLRDGAALLRQQYQDGTGEAETVDRVLGFLGWSPTHRAAVLDTLSHQKDPDERQMAYEEALTTGLPPDCPEAINDLLPWLLPRIRNERVFVRMAALRPLHLPTPRVYARDVPGCLLMHLTDDHVPTVEAALMAALAAPDANSQLQGEVRSIVAAMLRLGALRPTSPMLPAALRLHATLVKCCGGGSSMYIVMTTTAAGTSTVAMGTSGPWHGLLQAALEKPVLLASADAKDAVRRVLDEMLPRLRAGGDIGTERLLLAHLMDVSKEPQLAWLRDLPEVAAAAEKQLRSSFPSSRWAETTEDGTVAQEQDGKPDAIAKTWLCTCMRWWLMDPDPAVALERAQALLGLPGGQDALEMFVKSCDLCEDWLTVTPASGVPLPPAVRWWQSYTLNTPQLLELLVVSRVKLCNKLLKRDGAEGPLCQALLRERVGSWDLCTLPNYFSACLATLLQSPEEPDEGAGMKLMAITGKDTGGLQKGATHRERAIRAFINRWVVAQYNGMHGRLPATDLQRWPPQQQAQLRQLFKAVAVDEELALRYGDTSVSLLARLQDTRASELEAFDSNQHLTAACLRAAGYLADKQEAVRYLLSKLTASDAVYAAATLSRISSYLAHGELEELCGDLLSTVGVKMSAWKRIVHMLVKRGTPQAIDLVFAEMRRVDLSVSQRCALLEATSGLVEVPEVTAFWEQNAASEADKEVDGALFVPPKSETFKHPDKVACWWAGLALGRLTSCTAPDNRDVLLRRTRLLMPEFTYLIGQQKYGAVDLIIGALMNMAKAWPDAGWDVGLWLLQSLYYGGSGGIQPELREHLSRHLAPLLDAAMAEQAAGASKGPSTRLLLLLLDSSSNFPSPWSLGLTVPPVLAPLLWQCLCDYCADAAEAAAKQGAVDGANSLVLQLQPALAAAPSPAHVWKLAERMAAGSRMGVPGKLRGLPARQRLGSVTLSAARALVAAQVSGNGQAAIDRAVVAAALAVAGWRAVDAKTVQHEEGEEDQEEVQEEEEEEGDGGDEAMGGDESEEGDDAMQLDSGKGSVNLEAVRQDLLQLVKELLAERPAGVQVLLLLEEAARSGSPMAEMVGRSTDAPAALLSAVAGDSKIEEMRTAVKECREEMLGEPPGRMYH